MRQRLFLILLTFAALIGLLAAPLLAEKLESRVSQGNNIGMPVNLGWSQPFKTIGRTGQMQFPRGSGNYINWDRCSVVGACTRDFTGDGVPEDTIVTGSGGFDTDRYWASAFAYDYLAAAAAAGENVETESTRIDVSYVWSSLDEDNLANWPIEARQGQTASGAPVLHGAETICFHSGDVMRSYYGPQCGFYNMWSMYMLNFGESNNMIYNHIWMQNMTEYFKWNPTGSYAAIGLANPDGVKWHDYLILNNWRAMNYGGSSVGWMYHPARELTGIYGRTPTVPTFSPPEAPLVGFKMLRPAKFGDDEAVMISYQVSVGAEFGVSSVTSPWEGGPSYGVRWQIAMESLPSYFGGQMNPWTGQSMVAYPGLIGPENSRYDKWLWGGSSNSNYVGLYGQLHDMEPRDTTSFDFVWMFTHPGVKPFTAPTFDIANMDAQVIQDAFAPLEHYSEVAQIVFESGFQLPETPQAPLLTIIPGDRAVTITWPDVNVQTPDTYYYFLENNDLNPDNYYREYDFEGYRVYRSFVGPSDSHSELLADFNLSKSNLQFYYNDKLEDDVPLARLKNGQKVWYAVVPYDRNYDPTTGALISLPDPASGKTWNRPGASLYTVVPRSNANEFRTASIEGEVTYVPAYSTPVYEERAILNATRGIGSNNLGCVFTDPPQYLAPVAEVSAEIVNNERLTSPKTLTINASGTNNLYYFNNVRTQPNYSTLTFQLSDGSTAYDPSGEIPIHKRGAAIQVTFPVTGPMDASGATYGVKMAVNYLTSAGYEQFRGFSWGLDKGGYTGASLVSMSKGERPHWGWRACRAPYNPAITRSGRFTLTWRDAGGGNLTLEVKDATRGVDLAPVEYPDDYGWGFVTLAAQGQPFENLVESKFYVEMHNKVPKAQRSNKFVSSLPANNTEQFGIYFNGQLMNVTGLTSMPSPGTVFTYDQALGTWNEVGTVFTQVPDPPYPGDKWEIRIKPSTMNPDDIDLSKIKVVPNPYVGSSFLDLSPAHRRIEFINLPKECTIRIYTLSGNLVNVLNHISSSRQGWGNYTDWDRLTNSQPNVYEGWDNHSGTEPWNMRNRFGMTVASGLYFYHVTDYRGKTHTGSFYVIN